MKKDNIIIILGAALSIGLSGCGGGGGATPPTPQFVPQKEDLCAQYRNDGRNAEEYMTAEYCKNIELARLGVSTAYSNGYTGKDVTVAVLDSGVNMDHYDIKGNATSDGISFTAQDYNTSTNSIENTSAGVTSDQIESIYLSNGGSGYTIAPTVTISGDGTGAKAVAILDDSGSVSGIYMTERGSGYTNATITLDDNGTDGSGAEINDFYFGAYDDDGHGSAVAGIIAAVKQEDENNTYDGFSMQGVAYDAKILSIKVLDNKGYGATWQVEQGIDYAVDKGAQVINMSMGSPSASSFSNSKDHFSNALNANSTFVVAAGNSGLNCLPVNGSIDGQCDFPAALPWLNGNSDLLDGKGGWVVVGSVDENNNISTFSNRAGVTKEHYIVAPGEAITSVDNRDNKSLSANTGTSFATPFVSGAMALMIEKYPHLTGKEVAQIFFDTAKDLGEEGVDDVYGNGLIDVYAAFAPIGTLGIVAQGTKSKVNNKTKIDIKNTKLSLSSVLGTSLISSQALQNTVAFDDFGRGFNVDMTNSVALSRNRFSFDNFFMFSYNNLILGLDQLNQQAMIGYRFFKNNKIMMSYDDTLFGSQGEGALSFDEAHTLYSSLSGQISLNTNVKVQYQADYGFAQAKSSAKSLISNIGDIHALGGSVKAYYGDFGIGYQIPLSTVSGTMDLDIPISRELDGTVGFLHSKESMVSKDFEQDFSLFYQLKGKALNSFVSYEVIKNSMGVKNSELAQRLSLNVKYIF